ncbi:unnamed protein product [Cuscuta campestris]|uniref:Uncharacterized protein n=1 Tax=Cuscuta campestris TaxID=132261 RepID=A0A484KJU8_9ASTE|nr:unnamed protein product [Cuscuta campestris]
MASLSSTRLYERLEVTITSLKRPYPFLLRVVNIESISRLCTAETVSNWFRKRMSRTAVINPEVEDANGGEGVSDVRPLTLEIRSLGMFSNLLLGYSIATIVFFYDPLAAIDDQRRGGRFPSSPAVLHPLLLLPL